MHGIDVETAGKDGGGALTPEEGSLRLVQLSDGRDTDIYDAFVDDAEVIRRAVQAHDELVAHNAVFERTWLNAALELDRPDLHDTMIMSQVYYTGTRAALGRNFSHSLAAVVKRELKLEIDKEHQKSNWGAVALTREQLEYAAKDAKVMPRLAETLMRKIDKAGLRKTYELERRVSHAIAAMQRYGVAVHRGRLEEMIEESTAEAERLKAELAEEWGINPGSTPQLTKFFRLAERPNWPTTPAGAPSANQDAMKALVEEYPSVEKWVRWKEVEKIRSTYGTSLLKYLTPEGRIHARFDPFGTATGRFSSSTPNLQNIPKRGHLGPRMRGLFWSGSDDRVLIKADYASIELWVAARDDTQALLVQPRSLVGRSIGRRGRHHAVRLERLTGELDHQTDHRGRGPLAAVSPLVGEARGPRPLARCPGPQILEAADARQDSLRPTIRRRGLRAGCPGAVERPGRAPLGGKPFRALANGAAVSDRSKGGQTQLYRSARWSEAMRDRASGLPRTTSRRSSQNIPSANIPSAHQGQ